MVQLSKNLVDIVKFEPLFLDILREEMIEINHQHARILAMMFKLGGYTTLNVLTEIVNLAQPTVSHRVQELVAQGFLKKNSELMPMALVLLLDVSKLQKRLNKRMEYQSNAIEFITRIYQREINLNAVIDTLIKAIGTFYPENTILAKMIALVYANPSISRDRLFEEISSDIKDEQKTSKLYDELLGLNTEIFQIVYQKQKKKETFIQPRLPLSEFISNRKMYTQSLSRYYMKMLEELKSFDSSEYESIIPHQFLNYHSEIKQKIDACLKHYTSVRVINNSIFQQKFQKDDLITIISQSENFTNNHKLLILQKNGTIIPNNIPKDQITISSAMESLGRDYLSRDFLIFNNHGCLVIPAKPSGVPYYNISPRFTANIYKVFESIWRSDNAI